MHTDIAAGYPAGAESHTPNRAGSLLNFHQGSAHDLAFLPDGSVHAVITSPPYLGLRAYAGEQDIDWPEVVYAPMAGLPPITVPAQRCALGGETDPFAYIGHLLHCLREWKRVLRDDGCCMVNLGDSYGRDGGTDRKVSPSAIVGSTRNTLVQMDGRYRKSTIAPKNLLLIPSRFALAAQADGWIVRADIVWAKGVSFLKDYAGSSMPESVQDRPSRSHENIYLLAKRERYFWDKEAVAEPLTTIAHAPGNNFHADKVAGPNDRGGHSQWDDTKERVWGGATRNLRSVWVINPSGFSAAHFACWPESLVDPMIRATTSERGCCPACGASWVRVVEREKFGKAYSATKFDNTMQGGPLSGSRQAYRANGMEGPPAAVTTGFAPSCTCDAGPAVPCTVLDPFSGSGTTGKVAVRLGRRYVGVDLAGEYLGDVTDARMGGGVQMELVGT